MYCGFLKNNHKVITLFWILFCLYTLHFSIDLDRLNHMGGSVAQNEFRKLLKIIQLHGFR